MRLPRLCSLDHPVAVGAFSARRLYWAATLSLSP